MKFSLNSLSPLTIFLLGMVLILMGVFLEVANKYELIKTLLFAVGIGIEWLAVFVFLKKRKLAKQLGNHN
jgi:Na+-transporting NADH:ubiquinone oxidoreductase subunit NqrE